MPVSAPATRSISGHGRVSWGERAWKELPGATPECPHPVNAFTVWSDVSLKSVAA